MKATEAAAILRRYNEWRTGGTDYEYNSAQITEAIDVAIQAMEGWQLQPVTDCNEIDGHIPDAERDAAADRFIAETTAPGADHWSFKQGAKWVIERLNKIMIAKKEDGK